VPGQPSPFRGDVWDTRLPSPAGLHPAVVMSRDVRALSSVIVAVITGTAGPPGTHVLCDPDDGLTGYDVSYVNVTDLHAVDKARLQRFRGRLHVAALRRVEIALHDYLSFPCTGPERLP
jgi:mRNA interferase MazF